MLGSLKVYILPFLTAYSLFMAILLVRFDKRIE